MIQDSTIATRLYNAMEEDMKTENAWRTTVTYNPDSEVGWLKRTKVWFRGIVPKSVL
ncbi:MAG TPA: hypothetical protein PKU83_01765 [Chryseolinea sp.]|nr:hypothetical protein [Chryseolinea sp.]